MFGQRDSPVRPTPLPLTNIHTHISNIHRSWPRCCRWMCGCNPHTSAGCMRVAGGPMLWRRFVCLCICLYVYMCLVSSMYVCRQMYICVCQLVCLC